MKTSNFFAIAVFLAVTAQPGFSAEKTEPAQKKAEIQPQTVQCAPGSQIIEVRESGGEMFLRETGNVIDGIFKVAALPLHLLGKGIELCTPKAAVHRVAVPAVQPVVQPVIIQPQPVYQRVTVQPQPVVIAPTPVSVAPAPVVTIPAAVPVYYHGYGCYPVRYSRCRKYYY